MAIFDRPAKFQPSAYAAVFAAHLFGIIALVLMLVWLFHFRGGINLNSDDYHHIFNVHPFLMFIGFAIAAGEAIMVLKIIPAAKRSLGKLVHMILHLSTLVMGIIGIYAVFKYHDRIHISHVTTLHSWTGMGTISLFGLQWLLGFLIFMFPSASSEMKVKLAPLHSFFGLLIFLMAICSIQTGLSEQFIFSRAEGLDVHSKQARVMNFIGIMSLLYGMAVALTVILPQ